MNAAIAEEILKLFDGVRTIEEIVQKSVYARHTVWTLAKKNGLGCYGKQMYEKRQKTVFELRQSGLTWREIADRLGYSSHIAAADAARRHLRRMKKLEVAAQKGKRS